MTSYAIIVTATGEVVNLCEWDGVTSWAPPEGHEARLADDDAQMGGTWDGSKFIRAVIPTPSRLDVLMSEGPATQVPNADDDGLVDRPAEDIAADKAELLGLLQAKLADTGDLTEKEMNKMLALERES